MRRLIDIARPWLKFLGWWRAPVVEFQFQHQLDQYAAWMRDERGLSRQTVERWHAHAKAFLQWCEKTNQRLTTLRPSDIDCYFVDEGAQRRWSRVSISHTATALRAFLRYAAMLASIVFFGHQIGSFVGVWLAGYLYDHTGSYSGAFIASIGLGVFAALVNLPVNEQPLAERMRHAQAVG